MDVNEKLKQIKLQKSLVIMGFPGSGKTHFFKNSLISPLRVVDCDMVIDPKDKKGEDYVEFTKTAMENGVDVILLISHPWIREALEEAGIMYVLAYPSMDQKKSYLERYRERKSSDEFINRVSDKWEKWVQSCVDDEYPIRIAFPDDSWTMTDVVQTITESLVSIK